MEQYEYLTTFIVAEAKTKDVKEFVKKQKSETKNPPRFTPEAMMPKLNELGAQGWEIVTMTPVAGVGKQGNVRFVGDENRWSNTYFCVFKRRKA